MTIATIAHDTTCASKIFYGHCGHEVEAIGGRWFITMGHPGFNSPANNRAGCATSAAAMAAVKKYGRGRV